MGHTADEIHSNRSQNQRQKALKGFDKGKYRVLVATDIAARGIDVSHIKLVINYDLPDQLDDYVHRIGRTGRAGREGKAISFASPEQKRDVAKIQELINVILPIKAPSGEELAPITSTPKKKSSSGGRGKKRGSNRRRYPQKKSGGRSSGGSRSGGRKSSGGRGGSRKGGSSKAGGRGAASRGRNNKRRGRKSSR
jgi:ATP-dependent RNA helicase RhlE